MESQLCGVGVVSALPSTSLSIGYGWIEISAPYATAVLRRRVCPEDAAAACQPVPLQHHHCQLLDPPVRDRGAVAHGLVVIIDAVQQL